MPKTSSATLNKQNPTSVGPKHHMAAQVRARRWQACDNHRSSDYFKYIQTRPSPSPPDSAVHTRAPPPLLPAS
eukprot:3039487-Rhodomonas_salina.2